MYLSRLILNPRSRQVQRELADAYEMHRTILRAFPLYLPKDERILFRLEVQPSTGFPTLLVQSVHQPDWSFLFLGGRKILIPESELTPGVENPAVKSFDLRFFPGQKLAFRLRANPTVKKDRPEQEQGRRVGIYREADQLQWLRRKLEASGAILLSARISHDESVLGKIYTQQDEQKRLRFAAVQFDGVLQVKDAPTLMEAVQSGIGSGKGFGFGLLSLARLR